jgi:co-chaperonin GroES (HSP10)
MVTQFDIKADMKACNPGGLVAYDDHVLVQIGENIKTTESGLIVVPDSVALKASAWSVVLSVGFGVEHLEPGDTLIYKDSASFAGGAIVTKESAVYVDIKNRIVAVRKDQIVVFKKTSATDYEPYGSHFTAKVDTKATTSEGGIILTATKDTPKPWATVEKLGTGIDRIHVGDRIMFKDAIAFLNEKVLVKESAVVVDPRNRIISVHKNQVIALQPAGTP